MTVEQQITNGYVTYIKAMGYDIYRKHLILLITYAPEVHATIGTILFREVSEYQDLWHEEDVVDDQTVDTIIGITEDFTVDKHRYVICTQQRELHFTSTMLPEIIYHPINARSAVRSI